MQKKKCKQHSIDRFVNSYYFDNHHHHQQHPHHYNHKQQLLIESFRVAKVTPTVYSKVKVELPVIHCSSREKEYLSICSHNKVQHVSTNREL